MKELQTFYNFRNEWNNRFESKYPIQNEILAKADTLNNRTCPIPVRPAESSIAERPSASGEEFLNDLTIIQHTELEKT